MPYVTNFERDAENRGLECGLKRGREEGLVISYRQILGLPEISAGELSRLSLEELERMAAELKRELAERLKP